LELSNADGLKNRIMGLLIWEKVWWYL